MAIFRFNRSSQVDSFIAEAQKRFDVLREVQCLRAEKIHHQQRIALIERRLEELRPALDAALQSLEQPQSGAA